MNHKNNLITLSIIFIIVSIIFWGKTGNFLIDFSRETFIPYQMQGQNILIKDIFLIYGAFGYIVNWLLYKILTNINMLLFEAHLISYCILILMYFILNIFFSKKASLFLSALFIGVSIFSNSTFSFVVPYSFSTLWAVFGSFLALFSLLYNKKILLFLSLGLILANRIEFFIPIFIISLGYLIYSKEKFKKEFAYILIFPVLCGLYFLLNKVTFNEIARNYNYIKEMVNTEAIKYLYKGMGVFFEKEYFTYNVINFFKVIIIFAISHALFFIKKPAISYTFLIICLCFINTTMALNLIGLFSILLTILIHNKKHIKKEELLLFLFAIVLSSKAFFALNPLTYSNFGYLLILAYVFLQLQKFINKKWLINSLIIYLFFSSTANITYFYLHKKASFETKTGTIQININEYQLFKNTSDF
ncbi:MAG: hypothetical protein IJW73_02770, partial [Candidatus Gastranaerophilales bacterium]|nr:hypothetical protein [Candidatus Gastranaerophilales bacterium]